MVTYLLQLLLCMLLLSNCLVFALLPCKYTENFTSVIQNKFVLLVPEETSCTSTCRGIVRMFEEYAIKSSTTMPFEMQNNEFADHYSNEPTLLLVTHTNEVLDKLTGGFSYESIDKFVKKHAN